MLRQTVFLLLLQLVLLPVSATGGSVRGSSRQLGMYHWSQVGESILGEAIDDNSGNAVAVNQAGDIIAIGARIANSPTAGTNAGHVRVFKLDSDGEWAQLGSDIDGEAENDRSGYAVSLNTAGDVIAISARFNDGKGGIDSGHVRVWKYDGDDWVMLGTDVTADGSPLDGLSVSSWLESVSLNGAGNRVVIGASRYPVGGFRGEVRVYDYDEPNNDWVQVGQTLIGEAVGDRFGNSVSIVDDGSRLAVGSYAQDCDDLDVNNNCGSVSVYTFHEAGNEWVRLGEEILGPGYKANFGGDVSFSGDGSAVAVGASRYRTYAGQVQVFTFDPATDWTQVGGDIDGDRLMDRSGSALSISTDGTVVAVGAWAHDGDHGNDSGQVRIFGLVNDEWVMLGDHILGEGGTDGFGWALALSGDGTRVVAGSPDRAGENNEYRGQVRVFDYTLITPSPSSSPTMAPTTATPSASPSAAPSAAPTPPPSASPSASPSAPPSASPSSSPSASPTGRPSSAPTSSPSKSPTIAPSATPTISPSFAPSINQKRAAGTQAPTSAPTQVPLEDCWVAIGDFFYSLSEQVTELQDYAGTQIGQWLSSWGSD